MGDAAGVEAVVGRCGAPRARPGPTRARVP